MKEISKNIVKYNLAVPQVKTHQEKKKKDQVVKKAWKIEVIKENLTNPKVTSLYLFCINYYII